MADPVTVSKPVFVADPIPGSVRVAKVTGAKGAETYTLVRNVRPLSSSWREGGNPPTAELIYAFDDTTVEYALASPLERKTSIPPTRFEDVFPLNAVNPYVLQPDDRIAILMDRPDGSQVVLFDGYATAPDAQLSKDGEACPLAAMGLPVREFDIPLTGALWRGSDRPTNGADGMKTDLPARFNPDGKPNASPFVDDGSGGNSADYAFTVDDVTSPPFPIFMDPGFKGYDRASAKPTTLVSARFWTLGMAAKYILMGNPTEEYTRRPDFKLVDKLLKARSPIKPGDTYDPHDPDTYTESDIICQDYDCTDKPWPLAIEELIAPHGFGCCWRLDTTDDGSPDWWFHIYRKDEPVTIQSLKLQEAGSGVDGSQSNLTALSVTRDSREVINSFAVQSDPCRYQAWFVLAPGFPISASDAATPNVYTDADADESSTNAAYRLFHLNENGSDGFWDGAAMNYNPADLRKLIQEDGLESTTTPSGVDPATIRRYVYRRRPAYRSLFTFDPDQNPIQAQLYLIVGYTGGTVPGVMGPPRSGSPSPYMRKVDNGGWKLAGDRCGVRLTMDNPNQWDIGKVRGAPYFASGVVRLVECLAAPNPAAGLPYFNLVLLCAIEGDRGINSIAPKRAASPSAFTTIRRDDARDRYKKQIVLESTGVRSTWRDDTPAAQAHAEARRAAHETPKIAGQATVGRIVLYYWIGDKVDGIVGRDCSLRTTIGDGQGEGPQYMTIVGIDHRYDPEFATVILCDDKRAEPFVMGKEGDLDS